MFNVAGGGFKIITDFNQLKWSKRGGYANAQRHKICELGLFCCITLVTLVSWLS